MPAWATGEADVDSDAADRGDAVPDSDELAVEPSSVEPSPAWQELDEPHRPDPVQVWFQDEALAVPEAEVEPPAVEDEIPLSEPVSDTATADGADNAEETGLEETSPRELARHRRAGLVAERRAAKAERRRRRAEARLLRRGRTDRVSVPLEVDQGAEPVASDDDVLMEQERLEAERAEAERAEAERVELERAEEERLEAERAEAERAEAERAEAERAEVERAEEERLEAERAELAAAQEAEAARETEREAAEREAEEQRRAEQAEAERLETEQAELEAAAEDARAKAEQAEQRERDRQAKEAEREQAREAKSAERERRRAEKAERRAEKARAAAERRRDPVTETDGGPDDVPEPPDEVGSDRSDTRRRSRHVLPLVAGTLGALGLLFSVLLAVGAFLVAVGTDDSGSLFSALATVCDALTAPLSGLISFSGENADKKEALVMWGLGAMVYLAIGLAAQSVLAKRTETTDT